MPALWSPSKGVTVPEHPAVTASAGSANHIPRWVRLTGTAGTPGFRMKVSSLKALIPRRDEGCVRGVDDEERKLRVCREVGHLNVHVLNRSQVADRAPSASCGIQAGHGACR